MSKIKYGLAFFVLGGLLAGAEDETPKPAEPGSIVVIDSAGKEQKVKNYQITLGTRRLGWLAPADKKEDKPKSKGPPSKATGPEALVVRAELKFNFAAGTTTLVPIDRIRSIAFDNDKSTMTVRVAVSDKASEDVLLVGTTAYRGINKLTLEAEVDKGAAGVAELTFQGGVLKGGIKEVRFPTPKVEPFKPGRPAVVVTLDKDIKRTHKVSDLQPLYQFRGGREKLLPTLLFKKTLKLDIGNIKKISSASSDSDDVVWQVTQKDDDSTLTLLQSGTFDGQMATLVGLVGRTPTGYLLIPVRRISEIQFDTSEEEKEK